MPKGDTRPSRSSFRLAKLAPPPPTRSLLLSLPPETIDLILSFTVPSTLSTRNRRRQLSTLLWVHPSITPLVRRRLYLKATLCVGDPKGKDRKLLELLESGHVGKYVHYAKVRLPDPEPTKEEEGYLSRDPALAILPAPRLNQRDTTEVVTRAFEEIEGMRYLELDARVGTKNEGTRIEEIGDDVYGGSKSLSRLESAMARWQNSLETFIFNFADPYQCLQVFVDATMDYRSPFVGAFRSWNALSHLDLWRVLFKLPAELERPQFKLKVLRLRDIEFESASDLEWLINGSGALSTLVLQDLVFSSTPGSSAPLLAIFDPQSPLPFSRSLKDLQFYLMHPLGQRSPSSVLSSFVNLDHLLLGGAGIDLPLFASIFPPQSATAPLQDTYPSQSLETLTLQYLVHPSLVSSGYNPPPLDSIQPNSFHNTLFTHLLQPRAVPKLSSLILQPTGRFLRGLPWAFRQGIPIPTWKLSATNLTTRGGFSSSSDEAEAWEGMESPLRKVNRQRRRDNLTNRGGGGGGFETGPIKFFKNRAEIEYAEEPSEDEGGGEDEAEEDEFDPDALFEPSSDEEVPVVNVRNREQDNDSDF